MAHEQDNDAWFTFGRAACAANEARDTAADKINNEVGIAMGHNYKGSDRRLIADVTNAVVAGNRRFDFGSPCA